MRRSLLLLCLLGVSCLRPVDADAQVVASCRGDCPAGACSQECAAAIPDAGCDSPERCLAAWACARSPTTPCSSYTAERFGLTPPTRCASTPGSYCVEVLTSARHLVAVQCTDAGVEATDCSVAACDGGVFPASCRGVCPTQYCVR
ncbi:MAG: hypothetical protein JNM69_26550 [Archangium sp.]|nr:hypothetical protein [Archangium sp.]